MNRHTQLHPAEHNPTVIRQGAKAKLRQQLYLFSQFDAKITHFPMKLIIFAL